MGLRVVCAPALPFSPVVGAGAGVIVANGTCRSCWQWWWWKNRPMLRRWEGCGYQWCVCVYQNDTHTQKLHLHLSPANMLPEVSVCMCFVSPRWGVSLRVHTLHESLVDPPHPQEESRSRGTHEVWRVLLSASSPSNTTTRPSSLPVLLSSTAICPTVMRSVTLIELVDTHVHFTSAVLASCSLLLLPEGFWVMP